MQLQRCADRLTQRGRWQHDGRSHRSLDAGWSYGDAAGSGERPCQLLDVAAARHALRGRWVLVVGDSRARFIYSALLTLLNESEPALGWPTHRVLHGTCMAHVPPNRTREQPAGTFGYYSRGCQLRWKHAPAARSRVAEQH